MNWIGYLLGRRGERPETDRKAFERRENQLRERLDRLERMAVEADVISRTEQPEGQSWAER